MTLPSFPDLNGKSVFISGGGSGIGAALTEGFLRQGSKVAFCQRSDASAFCDKMEAETGNRPLFLPTDITKLDDYRATLDKAAEAHGPITALINNAANDKRHTFEETTEEFYDWMLAVNMKHYYFASHHVLPGMKAAGGGSIVHFTSISYMMGNGGYCTYTMANSGLNGLARSMARELGKHGIRVNAFAPGWVFTERQEELWAEPGAVAAHLARQCLPGKIMPEDMAGGVLFLASDASRMMTGQSLVIDAGVVVTG